MKKFTLFLCAMAVATLSFAQGHEPANDGSRPKTIKLTDAERELVKANNNFALRLFREARTEESAAVSQDTGQSQKAAGQRKKSGSGSSQTSCYEAAQEQRRRIQRKLHRSQQDSVPQYLVSESHIPSSLLFNDMKGKAEK